MLPNVGWEGEQCKNGPTGLFAWSLVNSNGFIFVTDYLWVNLVLYSSTLIMRDESLTTLLHQAQSWQKSYHEGTRQWKKEHLLGNLIVQIFFPLLIWEICSLTASCLNPILYCFVLHFAQFQEKIKRLQTPIFPHFPPEKSRKIKTKETAKKSMLFLFSAK